jgi:peptidoglycan-associated lipoprotein
MRRNRWMAFSMMIGLVIFMALTGCAGHKESMVTEDTMKDLEAAEKGLKEGGVISEEIQPIQPVEMQDISFAYDRYDLSPGDRATLADNAAWMENNPDAQVQIQGHCDERGSNQYNLALGDRRAKSAYNYLVNLGVSKSRLSSISYGEEMPACSEQNESCWANNRRAHFMIK